MKPNILLMITHDTGRRIASYGHKVDMPEMTKLAAESLQFNDYYCSAPQCSPSRGSVLTAKYPHNNGLMGLAHLGFAIDDKNTTLPKELKKNGYETTLIGLSHETIGEAPPIEDRVFSSTYALGYDVVIPVERERAKDVADETLAFLERKQADHQPFFVNVGIFETHRPFDEYEPYADAVEDVSVFEFLPDTPRTRKDVALYNGSAKVLDKEIGRIMAGLAERQLDKNTIVIVTTDHGVDFPKAKGALKSAGLETFLLIKMPDGRKGQRKALLSNVDLMPTILDLIGAQIPTGLDGMSFAELITGDDDKEVRDDIYAELTWHDRYHPMRSIRTKKHSYVRNFEDGPKIYMPIDSHLSLSGIEVRAACYEPNEPEELYDLERDPLERTNVINDPAYAAIAHQLRTKLDSWLKETNDPLLKGKVVGVGSKRWQAEIDAGRAYQPKEDKNKA